MEDVLYLSYKAVAMVNYNNRCVRLLYYTKRDMTHWRHISMKLKPNEET